MGAYLIILKGLLFFIS